ncbi:MAG: hypothetical protein CMM93_02330 [Rickettsiales bacterium]|nr:hypothetical protein [Rickettsiales bacterium]|tara:strand:- start:509 stop:778 length:270 start_codon:yes stop_codon:yes gene_type:complete
MKKEIAYEEHPVSPERKAELREQGYKIIDARFDPNRGTVEKAEGDGFDAEAAKAYLKEKGVSFSANIGEKKLMKLVEEAKAAEAESGQE